MCMVHNPTRLTCISSECRQVDSSAAIWHRPVHVADAVGGEMGNQGVDVSFRGIFVEGEDGNIGGMHGR